MNHLNSFLIEGNLTATPEYNSLKNRCIFTIESMRYYNQDNEKKVEVSRFDVETWNNNAQLCMKALSKGRGVRVVGRVKAVDGIAIVIGETVEFKARLDKKPSEVGYDRP